MRYGNSRVLSIVAATVSLTAGGVLFAVTQQGESPMMHPSMMREGMSQNSGQMPTMMPAPQSGDAEQKDASIPAPTRDQGAAGSQATPQNGSVDSYKGGAMPQPSSNGVRNEIQDKASDKIPMISPQVDANGDEAELDLYDDDEEFYDDDEEFYDDDEEFYDDNMNSDGKYDDSNADEEKLEQELEKQLSKFSAPDPNALKVTFNLDSFEDAPVANAIGSFAREPWFVDGVKMISFNIDDGTVVVSGTVLSDQIKKQIEDRIKTLPGVKNLQNNLQVQQRQSPTSAETKTPQTNPEAAKTPQQSPRI